MQYIHASLKKKIRNRELVIGTWVNNLHSPALTRMIGLAGFDFVSLDLQHGVADWETLAAECMTARLSGLTTLVRSYDPNNYRLNGKLMDAGACGLIVPDVESADMVKRTVESMHYFNGGSRGVVNMSYHTGFSVNDEALLRQSDEAAVLVIQIESEAAAERIEEILDVPGIDVVIVGRGDMAHSLGVSGQLNHPRVAAMVDRVYQAANERGITTGLLCPNAEKAKERIQAGAKFINYSNEQAILMGAYGSFLREVRGEE